MTELPDYMRLNESEEGLLWTLRGQEISACPSCGSVFLLHVCHANPVKGKGMKEAKPRLKGLRATYVIVDEIAQIEYTATED